MKLDGDELAIFFEYRPDEEKRKQKELNTCFHRCIAVDVARRCSLYSLSLANGCNVGVQLLSQRGASQRFREKEQVRSVLEKHLTDYTAKNTFDYFSSTRTLGALLCVGELDFFIKNEVSAFGRRGEETAPKVESFLPCPYQGHPSHCTQIDRLWVQLGEFPEVIQAEEEVRVGHPVAYHIGSYPRLPISRNL
ncbi:MAG: hypothetical protein IPH64_09635 [Comamonadaceae bacterium]|nr:hypothetical protein [Comamonadaceae bacterium]